jgi:hypothetical protein
VPKSRFSQIEVSLSFLLHILIIARIKIHKAKHKTPSPTTSQNIFFSKSNILAKLEKDSISDFVTNLSLILWAIAYSILQSKVNSLSLAEANTFPNYLFMFAYHLCGPPITGFAVALVYYIRHPLMKKKLLSELFSHQ